jgi:hypothetical protein
MGTESGLARFPPFELSRLVSYAVDAPQPGLDEDNADDVPAGEFAFAREGSDFVGEFGAAAGEVGVDMRRSVFVAGLLHIVHNAAAGLIDALGYWHTFVELLTDLTRFLSHTWSRQRLRATCFSHGEGAAYAHQYINFSSAVYEGRWGSVVAAIAAVLPLEFSLRHCWDASRYYFGAGRMREDLPQGAGSQVEVVNETI